MKTGYNNLIRFCLNIYFIYGEIWKNMMIKLIETQLKDIFENKDICKACQGIDPDRPHRRKDPCRRGGRPRL